jgi:hypothetical protein
MLTVTYAECHICFLHAECHYAECRYAECHGTFKLSSFWTDEVIIKRLGLKVMPRTNTPAYCFET